MRYSTLNRPQTVAPRRLRSASGWLAAPLLLCLTPFASAIAQTAPAAPPAAPLAAPPAAAPAPTPVPIAQAVLDAANALLSKANLPADKQKVELIIDPLIDGATGAQSVATRAVERRIVDLVHKSYPRYQVQPFNATTVARSPVMLIGTFTAINNAGQAAGPRDVYRVCLALADLQSGKIISKGVARAKMDDVNPTPTPAFLESPVWVKDPGVDGYIRSCQATKLGDAIDPVYLKQISTAAMISDAILAYDGHKYDRAIALYQQAAAQSGGDQLRVWNGLYLANVKLHHPKAAEAAFGKIVEYGLGKEKLSVKFLFQPGSTRFMDGAFTRQYPIWLNQIATKTAAANSCLEVVGHTSPTGSEPLNVRLSTLRAEAIKYRLEGADAKLKGKTIANGVGSRENLIGTGKDNATDALDRRVEFKVVKCT